jgi:hypothetical protein
MKKLKQDLLSQWIAVLPKSETDSNLMYLFIISIALTYFLSVIFVTIF